MMPKIPDALRALMIANETQWGISQHIKGYDEYEKARTKRQTLQIFQSNLFSTGGTFGMNFNRSATIDEIYLMIQSLQSFGRVSESPNQIIDSLIVSYSSSLAPDQQEKLDDHQINCAVVALSTILRFEKIDELLAKKHPRVKVINSKERFEKLDRIIKHVEHLHRHSDGSDDGEEY
jgi:hypothetical protein